MANFTLEMTFPKAIGAAGTGLDADHKVYKAYPGIPYRYFIAAVGGTPPFVFSLSGQPSGMAVNADTGEVTWSNPTTGTHSSIVAIVTDQDTNTSNATYNLVVGTSGFVFLDAVGGSDANTGTLASPWQTIDKLYDQTTLGTSCCYFRAGTYLLTGVPITTGADPNQTSCDFFESAGRCSTWLAYPGETVTIDFESTHVLTTGLEPALMFAGNQVYVDGFTFLDGYNKFLWMQRNPSRGVVVINCRFISLGPGIDSTNGGCVMWTNQSPATYNDVVVNNYSEDIGISNHETCLFKYYNVIKPYTAFNTGSVDIFVVETIAYKDSVTQWMDYRNNIVSTSRGWGGNMNDTVVPTGGEYWYSRSKAPAAAIVFNNFSVCTPIYYDRCTIQGDVRAENVDSLDGPFTFRNCVVVNELGANTPPFVDSPFSVDTSTASGGSGVEDLSRIVIPGDTTPTGTENLLGNAAAGILDSNGLLQGAFRTSFFGSWGHEIDAVAPVQVRRRFRRFRLKA